MTQWSSQAVCRDITVYWQTMRAMSLCLVRKATTTRQHVQHMTTWRPKAKGRRKCDRRNQKARPAATADKDLVQAARTLRSIIQKYQDDDEQQDQIVPTFQTKHPDEFRIIRRHGGVKKVSHLLPHMYGWAPSGRRQLTAPPDGSSERDTLQQMAENTRIMMLEDEFVLAGGNTVDMHRFEQEQIDKQDGNYIPKIVAIDVEGTHLVPPILIQICPVFSNSGSGGVNNNKIQQKIQHSNNNTVYLEQPPRRQRGHNRRRKSHTNGSGGSSPLSGALKRLLADASVLKVFFDGDGSDMKSLGVPINNTSCLQKEIAVSRSDIDGHRNKRGHLQMPSLIEMFNEYYYFATGDDDDDGDEGEHVIEIGKCNKDNHRPSLCRASQNQANSRNDIRYLYRKNRKLQLSFGSKSRPEYKLDEKLLLYGAADAWATAKIYQGMVEERQGGKGSKTDVVMENERVR